MKLIIFRFSRNLEEPLSTIIFLSRIYEYRKDQLDISGGILISLSKDGGVVNSIDYKYASEKL